MTRDCTFPPPFGPPEPISGWVEITGNQTSNIVKLGIWAVPKYSIPLLSALGVVWQSAKLDPVISRKPLPSSASHMQRTGYCVLTASDVPRGIAAHVLPATPPA